MKNRPRNSHSPRITLSSSSKRWIGAIGLGGWLWGNSLALLVSATPSASQTIQSPVASPTSPSISQTIQTLQQATPLVPTPYDGANATTNAQEDVEAALLDSSPLEPSMDDDNDSSDPMTGTVPAPSRVIIPPFTQAIPLSPQSTAVNLKNPTIGCTDILMQSQCFMDPSIKVVYTYVYTLCLMEFSLQKYLQSQQYMSQSVRRLEDPSKAALKEIQRVLPSAILGYKLVNELFQTGQLRSILDTARQQYQDKKQLLGY